MKRNAYKDDEAGLWVLIQMEYEYEDCTCTPIGVISGVYSDVYHYVLCMDTRIDDIVLVPEIKMNSDRVQLIRKWLQDKKQIQERLAEVEVEKINLENELEVVTKRIDAKNFFDE